MGSGKGKARRAKTASVAVVSDTPATNILEDGTKEWRNEKRELHRVGGPAIVHADNSSKYWYRNGELHREDGPAAVSSEGKAWFRNGLRHRSDGPAVELENGDKQWYTNGEPHRVDGPAVERADGTKEWWFDGKQVNEEEIRDAYLSKHLKNVKLDMPEKVTF
jgi:hypothetical protein